jgi:hypothetical protein
MPPKKENELPGRLKELKPVLDQPEEGVLFHHMLPWLLFSGATTSVELVQISSNSSSE